MKTPFADLHCHSTYSDGSLDPKELLKLAKTLNLKGISVTDHDTIDAYLVLLPLAKEMGLPLISGIEFSSWHSGETVHILGYSFNTFHPAILTLCQKHRLRRKKRNQMILHLLEKEGIIISAKELDDLSLKTAGRPHIAKLMYQKGYVRSIKEAFNRFIGDDKPCFAKGDPISLEETLDTIHQAKGFAVIAHPHLIFNPKLLKELLSFPFDGIEGHYGRFSSKENAPFLEIAQEKNWLVTGGSDFHGSIKPETVLGSSWTDPDTFQRLLNHFLSHELP